MRCIISALGAAGCPAKATKEIACSDGLDEHRQNSDALNGLARDSRSSRRPPPMRQWSPCRVTRERSLCCVGSWDRDHTRRRLASARFGVREKTRLCLPATEWVPRKLRDRTAERFPAARRTSQILGGFLSLLTGGCRDAHSRRAPHRVSARAKGAFTLRKSRNFFAQAVPV